MRAPIWADNREPFEVDSVGKVQRVLGHGGDLARAHRRAGVERGPSKSAQPRVKVRSPAA